MQIRHVSGLNPTPTTSADWMMNEFGFSQDNIPVSAITFRNIHTSGVVRKGSVS